MVEKKQLESSLLAFFMKLHLCCTKKIITLASSAPLHDDLDEHINYELRELRATPTFYFTIYEKFDSDYSPHIIHSYSDMGQNYPQRYFEHDF